MSNSFNKRPSDTGMREFNVGAPEPISTIGNVNVVGPGFSNHSTLPDRLMQQGVGYELTAAERDELQRFRKQAQEKNQLGEHAKKRTEILTNIGRLTKDVVIDQVSFGLRTLKDREAREATLSIFKCANDADAAYEMRRQTLARSLCHIDNQEVGLALGGDAFELRLELIDNMEETVVNKLYNAFNELRNEVRTKYGLTTEQQAKEVVEDLKK